MAERQRVVAVDLDGTLLEYNGWKGEAHYGNPIEGQTEGLVDKIIQCATPWFEK
jgi:hypothetical protein